jgi:hypothetical protein
VEWLRLLATVAWLGLLVAWPRPTFALTLVAIGGAFIAFNGMVFWETVVRGGEAPSVAPIFGGLLAAAGVAVLPVDGAWKWAWVPLLVDWGGLPMFAAGLLRHWSR